MRPRKVIANEGWKHTKGQQMSFAQEEYAGKKKEAWRDKFLAQMEQVMPLGS